VVFSAAYSVIIGASPPAKSWWWRRANEMALLSMQVPGKRWPQAGTARNSREVRDIENEVADAVF